jgi:hypothetical protein
LSLAGLVGPCDTRRAGHLGNVTGEFALNAGQALAALHSGRIFALNAGIATGRLSVLLVSASDAI